jgi:hypothetical protein
VRHAVVDGVQAAKEPAIGALSTIVAEVVGFFECELRQEHAMKR